jgi:branched-chain amino acid transport system substrate-binding protein
MVRGSKGGALAAVLSLALCLGCSGGGGGGAAPTAAPTTAAPASQPAPGGATPGQATGGAAASGSPVEVQVVLGQTGGGAFLAQAELQALQALETLANQQGGIQGRPVHFAVTDDQTNPSTDVQIVNRLMSQKTSIILGPTLVASCSAIAPLISNGPVMYCFSPGLQPEPGSYSFSSSVSTRDMTQKLIEYFRTQGWTKVASITSTDATGQDADNGIKAALGLPDNSGLQLVAAEHFNTTDVSVDAQISRIKAAQPQVVIAWSTGNPIATVFKAIAQSGMDVPVATTDGNMTYAQMEQYSAFLPKTLLIASGEWVAHDQLPAGPVKQTVDAFFAAMQAANIKPEIGHTLSWDPGLITIDALRHLGPDASAAQLRDYISNLTDAPGVDGLHNFKAVPQRGLDVKNCVVTKWDPAQGTWVALTQPTA